mmetsp:Transcript_21034/g.33730  ORF Transcript_21034/g.33730 Transcript_21034/m.33730 type:complete len:210 (-) Transcript_21034:526-1155(-)
MAQAINCRSPPSIITSHCDALMPIGSATVRCTPLARRKCRCGMCIAVTHCISSHRHRSNARISPSIPRSIMCWRRACRTVRLRFTMCEQKRKCLSSHYSTGAMNSNGIPSIHVFLWWPPTTGVCTHSMCVTRGKRCALIAVMWTRSPPAIGVPRAKSSCLAPSMDIFVCGSRIIRQPTREASDTRVSCIKANECTIWSKRDGRMTTNIS